MIVALGGFALAVLLAWQVVVISAAVFVFRLALRERLSVAGAILVAGALAAGLALFPLQFGRAANGARRSAELGSSYAERAGPSGRGFDVGLVDRAAELIPTDATYYLDVKTRGKTPLRFWALGRLLPRIAVDDPAKAEWIISWHADPHVLGVRYDRLIEIGPETDVGKVAR